MHAIILISFLFKVMKLMDCLNPLEQNYFTVNEYRVSKHRTRLSISKMLQFVFLEMVNEQKKFLTNTKLISMLRNYLFYISVSNTPHTKVTDNEKKNYFLAGKSLRILNCKVDCQNVLSILDLKFTAVNSSRFTFLNYTLLPTR